MHLSTKNFNFFIVLAIWHIDWQKNFDFSGHELRQHILRGHQRSNIQTIHEESTIKILKLGHNNIHSLSPNFFEYLKKLQVLELNNNPLQVIDQNTEIALGYLNNLQVNIFLFSRVNNKYAFYTLYVLNFSTWIWAVRI